jgi:hypothetical protein
VIVSTNQSSYKRLTPAWSWHLPWLVGEFQWDAILPSETRQRVWFLPAAVTSAAMGLALLTLAPLSLLTGRAASER